MDGRKEIIIKIPVESTQIQEFCRRVGPDDYWDNCEVLSDFIADQLIKYGICTPRGPLKFPDFYFKEIIKNAYDAYSSRGLTLGEELILKAVVLKQDDKIIVRIKDNGPGFLDKPKSQFFPQCEITKKQTKNIYGVSHLGYFGGKGIGLSQFCREMRDLGGEVRFKNRKEVGAVVQITFNNITKQPTPIPGVSLK